MDEPGRTNQGTRDGIVQLLRRGARTAEEIATIVRLTTNAVRQHLTTLERDGLIVRRGLRHSAAVGKPPTVYEIAPAVEVAFSRAYAPVLGALAAALPDHLPRRALDALFADVAARLAAPASAPRGDFRERVRAGAATLEALGGVVEVESHGGDTATIRGCSCVLGEAVAARPELCQVVEAMLAAVAGVDVREHCDRAGPPRCRFELTARA